MAVKSKSGNVVLAPWREGGVGIVGAGAVGSALARALDRLGYPVVSVTSRTFASAQTLANQLNRCTPVATAQEVANQCAAVFLTTPDSVIEQVAKSVRWRASQDVLHCSGAASLEPLATAQTSRANVGVFHPLQTFPNRDTRPSALRGITFGIQAQSPLQERLEALAFALGSRPFLLNPEDVVLYHTSAVLACAGVTTLAQAAAGLWEAFGRPPSRTQALEALLPLIRGTVQALETQGLPAALTGPLARGDVGTVHKHLSALQARSPESVPLYCQIGIAQLLIALAKGTCSVSVAEELHRLFIRSLSPVAHPAPTE